MAKLPTTAFGWISIILAVVLAPTLVSSCSRTQCAPIISKCQLLEKCMCETRLNHTCFKTCSHCLGELYTECCSCVGICPKENENDKNLESHVKLFQVTNEDLFELFVVDDDLTGRWHVHTSLMPNANASEPPHKCVMTFLSNCVEQYKCESACSALGATGYRWFHMGCCECVGKYCVNFGVNEIRCRNCPTESNQVIDTEAESL